MGQEEPEQVVGGVARRLHMIGHGHIDAAWLWPWWEGMQEVWSTFRSALDRMNEHSEVCFVASSAAHYEWVERLDPGMLDEIRRRVEEGRWEIVGGWWMEPDCNIPGGEALVRQALHGQRYFLSRFGRAASIGFNVDSFGHPGSFPQLLRGAGLGRYVFLRPGPHEQELPGRIFHWESPDGSRVLALRVTNSYNSGPEDVEEEIERNRAEIRSPHRSMACFFGIGNHGGGPTRANLAAIDRLRHRWPDTAVEYGTLEGFFAEADREEPLPTHRGELQHHASGCYAAHSGIKRWNRRTEQMLLAAERAQVLASRVGAAEPTDLGGAWRALLFNQFHDILAGTSLASVYDSARDGMGEAAAIAERELYASLQAVAARIDIPAVEGSTPAVVFNPHSFAVDTVVELEASGRETVGAVEDESGGVAEVQQIRSEATVGGRHRIAFRARLPAMGYRVYRTRPGTGPEPAADGGTVLEDEVLRLALDPETGLVSSLVDRRSGDEILAAPGGVAAVIEDRSDTWSHGVYRFLDQVGAFAVESVRRVASGPVQSTVRVESRFEGSHLRQDYTLVHGLGLVVIDVTVDWHQRWQALKLRWPVAVHNQRATYEIAHGSIGRPTNGEEEPMQGWCDLSGTHLGSGRACGLSLLNDGKYGADVEGRTIGLTALRSPVYAHHDPRRVADGEADSVEFQDQGVQRFRYALLPHAGSWREAATVERAASFNQPAVAFWHTSHPGRLGRNLSLLSVAAPGVVAVAAKPAEDARQDTILRLLETRGQATEALLTLPGWEREHRVRIGANQLITLRLPADPASPVTETDLIERDLAAG